MSNPLQKYYRQPKIYLKLPSKGKYYPEGSLEMPESGELPVYPMTAKDELMMKTPDALLNGEATIELIKSCIPAIKNPWVMPSFDIDSVLIAIRLATSGEKLDITTKIPKIGEERTYQVDLRMLLDQLINFEFDPYVQVDDEITVHLKPTTYKEFTTNSMRTFEEQRVFKLLNNNTIPDEQKLQAFANSFRKLTNLTIDLVINSISHIHTPDGTVYDREVIKEFFENSDRTLFQKIMNHLDKMKEGYTIKPLVVECTEEEIAAGAPKQFEVPITFDQANFFV